MAVNVKAKDSKLTQGLFLETADHSTASEDATIFTLQEDHYTNPTTGKTYYSIYRLYMEEADVGEVRFASKYFANTAHWQRLCKAPFFKNIVEGMRRDLSIAIRASALETIIDLAKLGEQEATRLSASKFLVDGKWNTTFSHTQAALRGRPTKTEIENRLHAMTTGADAEEMDLARILSN